VAKAKEPWSYRAARSAAAVSNSLSRATGTTTPGSMRPASVRTAAPSGDGPRMAPCTDSLPTRNQTSVPLSQSRTFSTNVLGGGAGTSGGAGARGGADAARGLTGEVLGTGAGDAAFLVRSFFAGTFLVAPFLADVRFLAGLADTLLVFLGAARLDAGLLRAFPFLVADFFFADLVADFFVLLFFAAMITISAPSSLADDYLHDNKEACNARRACRRRAVSFFLRIPPRFASVAIWVNGLVKIIHLPRPRDAITFQPCRATLTRPPRGGAATRARGCS
jgi:hypothetical protein